MRVARSLVLLVGGLPAVLTAQSVSFDVAPSYSVGTQPGCIAIGDFNGDGTPDLALVNGVSQDVSVLLGIGNGAFAPAIQYGVGGSPGDIGVGDFDGDAALDLVVTLGAGPGIVAILFGTGSGDFAPPVMVGTPGTSGRVAVADVNGDTFLDLAVSGSAPDSVGVLLGTGTGSFGAVTPYPVGTWPQDVAVADLNNDSVPDIVCSNVISGGVSVLLGTGAGAFAPAVSYPGIIFPNDLVVGDFNGDGVLDLALAGGAVHVLLGTGAGAFGSPTPYAAEFGSSRIAVGQFDSDTASDLAVSSFVSVGIMRGDGVGGFGPPLHYGAGLQPNEVTVGDLDGDGLSDLAVSNFGGGSVSILLRRDATSFRAPRVYPVVPGDSPSIAAGAFGSGGPGVAVASLTHDNVSVLVNAGNGEFAPTATYPAAPTAAFIRAADINGDANPDLVLSGFNNGLWVLLAEAGGGFGAPTSHGSARFATSGDLNGDPFADVVVVGGPSDFAVRLGDGSGGLAPPVGYDLGQLVLFEIGLGNFNGDTFLDVVGAYSGIGVAPGTGTGAFGAPVVADLVETCPSLAVGDFNSDGVDDVALARAFADALDILLGNGDGSFGAPIPRPLSGRPGSPVVGDFNGDGLLDLAMADPAKDLVTVVLGTGTGVLLPPQDFLVPHAKGLAVGDFDGDARLDLVAVGDTGLPTANLAWMLRNSTLPQFADLSVAMDDGSTQATPGSPISYAITVTNLGPAPVAALTAVATIPPEILNPVFVASAGTYDPATGLWSGLSLASAQSVALTLSGDVSTNASGSLTNSVSVSPVGFTDTDPSNNTASDTDSIVPAADLAVTKTGSTVPVQPGSNFSYTITVSNNGPVDASGSVVTDVLPPAVTFASSASCTEAAGTVTCALGGIAVSASASVTIDVTANPGYAAAINTASVSATEVDPIASNDNATDVTILDAGVGMQLTHGSVWVRDLAALPGPTAHQDLFRLSQEPRSSYEVVVDSVTGDLATAGSPIRLQRLDLDLVSVLQDASPLGTGFSRSLRFENSSADAISHQIIGLSSGGCSTDCDAADTYRIRAWDTTSAIPRFNNSASQVTVLVVDNVGADPLSGTAWFWDAGGAPIASLPFSIAPWGTLVFDTSTLAPGGQGSITVSHDGRYGQIQGKAVAVEPATGFTFETDMQPRPR